jgi:tRNA(Ile)-lysidine synthase
MMLKQFLDYIENQHLFLPNQRILLAVSGGVDSMAMVSLFGKAHFDFGIAHCNFKLRGAESDEDAAFVRKTAMDLGIPCFEKSFDTMEIAIQKKQSIQVAARELRYEWFNQVIAENNYDYFATAHQFDDQTETFFINLLRGTGISGLRGILPKNGKCVRPLLFASRTEIEGFAAENGITFREDSSNKSDKYLRNKIRQLVIPALEKVNPDFRKGLLTTFKNLAATEAILDNEIAKVSDELLVYENDQIKIDIGKLRRLYQLPVYLFGILKPYNFNFSTIEDICNALDKIAGKRFYSSTHCLSGNSESLAITPISDFEPETSEEFIITEVEDSISHPVFLTFAKIEIENDFKIQKDENLAQLDFDKLCFPLKLRKWIQGDTFVPLGMKGKKLVSDFFIDEKYSFFDKQKTWLLISGNEIVWIVGHRISNSFKITDKTTMALIIGVKNPGT